MWEFSKTIYSLENKDEDHEHSETAVDLHKEPADSKEVNTCPSPPKTLQMGKTDGADLGEDGAALRDDDAALGDDGADLGGDNTALCHDAVEPGKNFDNAPSSCCAPLQVLSFFVIKSC